MEGGDETLGRVGEELVREAYRDFLPPSRKFKLKLQFYGICFALVRRVMKLYFT